MLHSTSGVQGGPKHCSQGTACQTFGTSHARFNRSRFGRNPTAWQIGRCAGTGSRNRPPNPSYLDAAAQAAAPAVRAQHASRRHGKGEGGSGGAQAAPTVGQLGAWGERGGQGRACCPGNKTRYDSMGEVTTGQLVAWEEGRGQGRACCQEKRRGRGRARCGSVGGMTTGQLVYAPPRQPLRRVAGRAVTGCERKPRGLMPPACRQAVLLPRAVLAGQLVGRGRASGRRASGREGGPTVQHVHAQGGPGQAHQAQLQALGGVAVQGVVVGRLLQRGGGRGRKFIVPVRQAACAHE